MRTLLAVLLLFPLLLFSQNNGICVLKGHIDGLGNDKLTFFHMTDSNRLFYHGEKVKAHNGDFTFKASLSEPTFYMVHYNNKKRKGLHIGTDVFLEPGNITLTGTLDSLQKSKVTGSALTNEWRTVTAYFSFKIDSFIAAAKAADKAQDSIKKHKGYLKQSDYDALAAYFRQYIISHPALYVSMQLLLYQYGYDTRPAESQPLYTLLDDKLKNTIPGKIFKHKLDKALQTNIGLMAPDINLTDLSGRKISLSSFRGKVTLLDFWASWCGPCRAENPALVKAYNAYHQKGFEIYAVSLDANKTAWKNAMAKDSLTWAQVSDLKGWKSDAAQLYSISAIPSNVLIDANGLIIAKNLRGDELEKKLAEVLK